MSWVLEVHRKAVILIAQSELARQLLTSSGRDGNAAADAILLKVGHLYEDEFPLARTMDVSELIVSVEGPAVDDNQPPLALLTHIFTSIQQSAQSYALEALRSKGIDDSVLVHAELVLTGIAPDFVYLGIGIRNLAGPDVLQKQACEALRTGLRLLVGCDDGVLQLRAGAGSRVNAIRLFHTSGLNREPRMA
ncbi:hypothetical protein [Stenotrophomonas maltophilia]|uniref:hypothetical protein n=1 Tax=Stenotrophomonas maltophilia TaxID=40324 RepID=UPI00066E15AE|nr:hypothetical protein [Stenotrophomonas maltophilia]